MKATLILASVFSALAVAVPVNVDTPAREATEVEARQARTIRVQLSRDATDTAVQAEIPANGSRVTIRSKFSNLGNPIQANRAFVVSGSGTCNIFRDANAQQRVATIKSNGGQANFGNTNLQNGVIICQ